MDRRHSHIESLRANRQSAPCVSIYLNKPHSRLSGEVASIALYGELSYAKRLLENSFSRQKATDYLKPLLKLAKDELLSDESGTLALFKSGDASSCLLLKNSGPSQTFVADSFHIKPLLKRDGLVSPQSTPSGNVVSSFFEVAQALKRGDVKRLWIAEDVSVWGLLNRERGSIVLHPKQLNERDGDVLDDLLEWGLDENVETFVLPIHQLPSQQPVIAELKERKGIQ